MKQRSSDCRWQAEAGRQESSSVVQAGPEKLQRQAERGEAVCSSSSARNALQRKRREKMQCRQTVRVQRRKETADPGPAGR